MVANPPMFDLRDEADALRETVDVVAKELLKPTAASIDHANDFPRELRREIDDFGLLGIAVDDECGGAAKGYLAHVVAVQEVAQASASVALSYGAPSSLCVNQIELNGSREYQA